MTLNIFRIFKSKNKSSIVFIPLYNGCAADRVHQLIKADIKQYDVHCVKIKTTSLSGKILNKKVIMFGHPDKSKNGLANSVNHSPLLPNDFNFLEKPIRVFGNICFGSQVLAGTYWSHNVNEYISFSSEISFCSGSDKIDKYWRAYFLRIIQNFNNTEDLDAYHDFLKAYLENQIVNLFSGPPFLGQMTISANLGGVIKNLIKKPSQ